MIYSNFCIIDGMNWYQHICDKISNSWFIGYRNSLQSKLIDVLLYNPASVFVTHLSPTSPKTLDTEWTIEVEDELEAGYAEDLAGFIYYAPYVPIYISKGEQTPSKYSMRIIKR